MIGYRPNNSQTDLVTTLVSLSNHYKSIREGNGKGGGGRRNGKGEGDGGTQIIYVPVLMEIPTFCPHSFPVFVICCLGGRVGKFMGRGRGKGENK